MYVGGDVLYQYVFPCAELVTVVSMDFNACVSLLCCCVCALFACSRFVYHNLLMGLAPLLASVAQAPTATATSSATSVRDDCRTDEKAVLPS